MIERLGAQGAPLAGGLLERIGELCAGGDEAAAASGGAIDDALLLVAQNALGQAMQVRLGVVTSWRQARVLWLVTCACKTSWRAGWRLMLTCSVVLAAPTSSSLLLRALQALGPEAVLAALPLNLAEGLAGTGEARTWLLLLLRMHVRGARLGYWGKVLLPLARELGARAAAAAR